jgi:hypothetical protein
MYDSIFAEFLLEWETFQTKICREKTRICCSVRFLFENHAVCEIMITNIVEPGRSQMTVWRKRIEWWIPKSTNTHSEYVIIIAFALLQKLYESASMLPSTLIACLANTEWFKKMDSISYGYISWTMHGMWMIYITFERGGPIFSNTAAKLVVHCSHFALNWRCCTAVR